MEGGAFSIVPLPDTSHSTFGDQSMRPTNTLETDILNYLCYSLKDSKRGVFKSRLMSFIALDLGIKDKSSIADTMRNLIGNRLIRIRNIKGSYYVVITTKGKQYIGYVKPRKMTPEEFKKIRVKSLDMRQHELARVVGKSAKTIMRYENAIEPIPPKMVELMRTLKKISRQQRKRTKTNG